MDDRITVFAIDDEEDYLLLLSESLMGQKNYEVLTFADPKEALEQCLWICPDVILVDMQMPTMRGVDFCRELSAHLGVQIPPIIVLSGVEEEEAIAEAFEAGAKDYIVKPFPLGLLLAKIRRALGKIKPSKATAAPQACPRRIGRYTIINEIGRGGMGVVYKAIHPESRAILALKTLWFRSEDLDAAMRFRREIDVLQSLSHRNLAQVHEVGRSQNVFFYAMDYIQGQTLSQRMRRLGRLPASEALNVLVQMCEVLSYLHSFSIVHRDVKPSNIMIDGKGRVVLMDFGLSKVLTDNQLTATGNVVGTPHFMAPEVIMGEQVDHRADLFSLGMVLFEIMLGHEIIVADSVYEVMTRIAEGRFPRPSDILPEDAYPLKLVRIIDTLVEVEAELRYQSADEALADARALQKRRAIEETRAENPKP